MASMELGCYQIAMGSEETLEDYHCPKCGNFYITPVRRRTKRDAICAKSLPIGRRKKKRRSIS